MEARGARAVDTRKARMLAAAEELAQMGSFELDLRTGEVVWSEGFDRILGLEPADRRTVAEILELIHPDDRERIERLLADMAERRHEFPENGIATELRMLHVDGSSRELRALGRLEQEEGPSDRWIGSVQDVTEQRLSDRELRAHYSVSQALREWESAERLVLGPATVKTHFDTSTRSSAWGTARPPWRRRCARA